VGGVAAAGGGRGLIPLEVLGGVERILNAVAVGLAIGLLAVTAIQGIVLLRRPGDTLLSLLRRVLLTVSLLVFAPGAGILVASLAAWTAVVPLPVSVSLLALGGTGAIALRERRPPAMRTPRFGGPNDSAGPLSG